MLHTMNRSRNGDSLFDLIAGLREDVRNLVHEEVQLAKTEISEKASYFGRNTVFLAIGAVIALLGATLFLTALSLLSAYGLQALGLNTPLSLCLGFLAIALISAAVGGIMISKALGTLKKESLVPEKTIQTLREIKDGGLEQAPVKWVQPAPAPADKRNSDQIRADVEETRSRIGREVRGIRTRLNLATMAVGVANGVRHHPLRSVGIGVGTGVAGLLLMRAARLFGRRAVV